MATKSAGEFRNGMTLEIDGKVCQVIDFMHVKPGKGAAFVRVKLKDIINGGVVETTFRPTESFQEAFIERKKMQYLYNDGDLYYFMDNETYDQIAVSSADVGDSLKFVKENEEVSVSLYQEKPLRSNRRSRWSWWLQRPSPDLRVIRLREQPNRQLLRQGRRLPFRCLSSKGRRLRLIPVPANICQGRKG